jgi:chorismate mutase / prephenate dehydratase
MAVAYLGPEKTNSEIAARALAKGAGENELVPVMNIQAVADAVGRGSVKYGVIPYYNYLEGLIQQTLDLIYENFLHIRDIYRMPITHVLGSYPGNPGNSLYSISVAIGQCDEYLAYHYPDTAQIAVSSTAEGARIVSEKKEGMAIGNSEAMKHFGLEIIADDIGNRRHGKKNFTDFYFVSKERNTEFTPSEEYFTMVAITPHVDKPGLLAQILSQVAYHGINNAKIHSRPAIDFVDMTIDPQMFYLEMMCHEMSRDFLRCMDTLKYGLTPEGKDIEVVRVLGSYRRPIRI